MKPDIPPPSSEPAGSRRRFYLMLPRSLARGPFLSGLKRAHAWIGLAGALLGLLLGWTGITLLLQPKFTDRRNDFVEKSVPDLARASPEAFAAWAQREFGREQPGQMARTAAKTHRWGDVTAVEPERWQAAWRGTRVRRTATWHVGSAKAVFDTETHPLGSYLERLHMNKAYLGNGWFLLLLAAGGGMIAQVLTGVLLWTRLHGPRLLAVGLVSVSALVFVVLFLAKG